MKRNGDGVEIEKERTTDRERENEGYMPVSDISIRIIFRFLSQILLERLNITGRYSNISGRDTYDISIVIL